MGVINKFKDLIGLEEYEEEFEELEEEEYQKRYFHSACPLFIQLTIVHKVTLVFVADIPYAYNFDEYTITTAIVTKIIKTDMITLLTGIPLTNPGNRAIGLDNGK